MRQFKEPDMLTKVLNYKIETECKIKLTLGCFSHRFSSRFCLVLQGHVFEEEIQSRPEQAGAKLIYYTKLFNVQHILALNCYSYMMMMCLCVCLYV